MMRLHQLDWERSRERDEHTHFRLVSGFDDGSEADDRYLTAFEAGLFDHVADIDGQDLDFLYSATNNGILSQSWSRMPPEGVFPVPPTFHPGDNGEKLGRRSTSVGDIVELDGRLHVVANFGFRDIGPAPEETATPSA